MASPGWTPTYPPGKLGVIVETCTLNAGDTSTDLVIPDFSDKTIHIFGGTFGNSAVSVKGLNSLSGTAQTEALTTLLILAGLRHLQPLVREETQQMAITLDIENNPFLRDVFEEGRQEGQIEGERALVHRQLERRFGVLPAWVEEHIAAADTPALEQLGLRLLDATSLEEVFRTP